MTTNMNPSFDAFLAAPREVVSKIAPPSVVYAPGGTRRQAAFLDLEPWSKEYTYWSLKQTIKNLDLLFSHGVRHVFSPLIISKHLLEVNRYRHNLFQLATWYVAGAEAISHYQEFGWKVRLLGSENVPELEGIAEKLQNVTSTPKPHNLWWIVAIDQGSFWTGLISTAKYNRVMTQSDLIMRLYGEDIPLITLYIAFGKPFFSPELIPPVLMGEIQCYWSQRAGYSLDEEQLRLILYDYAYLRNTWQEDKLDRAYEALKQRAAWERGPIIGLGERLGPFWYPAPTPSWQELMDEEST